MRTSTCSQDRDTPGSVRLTGDGAEVGGGASAEPACSCHRGGRGSCCHCQILSRAAGRKQQMVELVPEQCVKARQVGSGVS